MADKSTTDQILDLLLDALQERQTARTKSEQSLNWGDDVIEDEDEFSDTQPTYVTEDAFTAGEIAEESDTITIMGESSPIDEESEKDDRPAEPPPLQERIHLERLLVRMVAATALLLLLINIPINRHGTALARAMPDQSAMIIRDGLLLKGDGPKVYVLQDNQRRWITSLTAFESFGYRWENVHEVEDQFLNQFPEGDPIYLLLKCEASPHVYALEGDGKRWIKDIPTFQKMGFVWQDIQMVPCDYLRNLADGIPFPADAGEPPQP